MNRPTYETPADRQNEARAVTMVAEAWRCDFKKLSVKYQLDYALSREGQVFAVAEIKTRQFTAEKIDELGGYMIGLDKYLKAKQFEDAGLKTFIVPWLRDGLFYRAFGEYPHVSFGGRKDRGDPQDIEPCVYLPMDSFKKIGPGHTDG